VSTGEGDLTSDRMAAKCAIFDATHTIPAFCRNAIEKMKIFGLNNHKSDFEMRKQAQMGQNAAHKGRKIRDFAVADWLAVRERLHSVVDN
jgi:hypothetical protein